MTLNPIRFAWLLLLLWPGYVFSQDLQDGLLIHYPLDGTVEDASENGFDGTAFGIDYAMDRFGNPDGAAAFDGTARIEFPADPALKPALPLTLSFWLSVDASPAGERGILSTDFIPNNYFGISLSLSANDEVVVRLGDGDSRTVLTGSTSLLPGQWNHVVVVIRSIDDVELYISGCRENSTLEPGPASLQYSDGVGNLGRSNAGSPAQVNWLNGLIDDFRYYDRSLSEEEINAIYDRFFTPDISLGNDTMICIGETLLLEPETTLNDYTWNDGSMGLTFEVDQTGTYSVSAETDDCQVVSDSIEVMVGFCDQCEPHVPNAFTPDNDGVNDSFRVLFDLDKCRIVDAQVTIFNRWGQVVFESNSIDERWDGRYNNEPQPSDVYIYFVRYAYESEEGLINQQIQGDLTLIR